jgi:hypothetical protein
MDMDGERFVFPDIYGTIVKEEPDEDGFIEVDFSLFLRFHGAEEVKDGLSKMLSCMVLEQ